MKGILYNFSIYKKMTLFLTIFAGSIIFVLGITDFYSMRQAKMDEYKDRLEDGETVFKASLERLQEQVLNTVRNRSNRHPFVTALRNNKPIIPLVQRGPTARLLGYSAIGIISSSDSLLAFSSDHYEPDVFQSIKKYIIRSDSSYAGLGLIESKNRKSIGIIGVAPIQGLKGMEAYFVQILDVSNGFCDRIKETTGVDVTIWIESQRYATSNIDKNGNRILNISTDSGIINKVLRMGETYFVQTDLLSKRDFLLVSPLYDLFSKRMGMYSVGMDAGELAKKQNLLILENIIIEFIIFLIVIFVSMIFARKITDPLVEFQKMAAQISVGDYVIPEFKITGKDEINSLKNSFNKMLYEILQREKRELEFKHDQAQRLEELTILNDIASAININQDIDVILELILKKVTFVTKTQYGSIILFGEEKVITKYINTGFQQDVNLQPFHKLALSTLIKERKIVSLSLDAVSEFINDFTKLNLSGALCVPFILRGKVNGALCLFFEETHSSFSDAQLHVLKIVAENSIRVIENVRLYQSERKREQMQHELELAKEIQQHLLLTEDIKIPGFEIAMHNTPSLEVSGDYYDIIRLDKKKVAVSIADVSGKGVSAALLMANLQAAVRILIRGQYSLEEFVARISNLIFENTEGAVYITFFVAVIDIVTGKIEYVNAGHNPPVIFRRVNEPGKNVEYLKTGGIILGWLNSEQYTVGNAQIGDEDILLLYTDGVTEAMNQDDEEYGEERLIKIVQTHWDLSSVEIKQKIISSIVEFTGSKPQSDDITLMIIKKKA